MQNPIQSHLPVRFPPDYASAWGEDVCGYWFDLSINQVIQRFRWIPAGEFMMGSPITEEEREPWSGKETLHQVTLTQGFWLADTACTQALWQLMMENNPADFQDDPQNPIETVSWLDCQEFLNKLNKIAPDLNAQLPTEAQWECACRAGTSTTFSFGETITTEQVNFNGHFPYGDAEKGEDRNKTVKVKALPANHWGLYQMHGNVWEWCQDEWSEELGSSPVTDPYQTSEKPDSDEQVPRVLRGGSWYTYGRDCRSAIRLHYRADYRYRNYGFRVVLGLGATDPSRKVRADSGA